MATLNIAIASIVRCIFTALVYHEVHTEITDAGKDTEGTCQYYDKGGKDSHVIVESLLHHGAHISQDVFVCENNPLGITCNRHRHILRLTHD